MGTDQQVSLVMVYRLVSGVAANLAIGGIGSNSGSGGNTLLFFRTQSATATRVEFLAIDSAGTTFVDVSGNVVTVNDGAWHCSVVTVDLSASGAVSAIYTDGVLDQTATRAAGTPSATTFQHICAGGVLRTTDVIQSMGVEIALLAPIRGLLGPSRALSLSENPWQLLQRRVYPVIGFASGTAPETYAGQGDAFQIFQGLGDGGGSNTFTYAGSGGITLAGSAARAKGKAFLPAGGITLSGTATKAKGKAFLPSGGATFGGAATTSKVPAGSVIGSWVGTGGITLAGAALLAKGKACLPTGGVAYAGAALTTKGKAFLPAGGITLSGIATKAKGKAFLPAGGITLSGAATKVKGKAFLPSGGATFGGTAATSYTSGSSTHTYTYTGTGGVTFSGLALLAKGKAFAPAGGIVFAGAATVSGPNPAGWFPAVPKNRYRVGTSTLDGSTPRVGGSPIVGNPPQLGASTIDAPSRRLGGDTLS